MNKFCIECKHGFTDEIWHRCRHPMASRFRNQIDGTWPDCYLLREMPGYIKEMCIAGSPPSVSEMEEQRKIRCLGEWWEAK